MTHSAAEAYNYLVSANATAFAEGDFDAAYHALAAALHLAQSLRDCDRLDDVQQIASRQAESIDVDNPEYHHSTQSASKRGNKSIFANLASQAHTASNMAKAKRNQV